MQAARTSVRGAALQCRLSLSGLQGGTPGSPAARGAGARRCHWRRRKASKYTGRVQGSRVQGSAYGDTRNGGFQRPFRAVAELLERGEEFRVLLRDSFRSFIPQSLPVFKFNYPVEWLVSSMTPPDPSVRQFSGVSTASGPTVTLFLHTLPPHAPSHRRRLCFLPTSAGPRT